MIWLVLSSQIEGKQPLSLVWIGLAAAVAVLGAGLFIWVLHREDRKDHYREDDQ